MKLLVRPVLKASNSNALCSWEQVSCLSLPELLSTYSDGSQLHCGLGNLSLDLTKIPTYPLLSIYDCEDHLW